MSFESHSLQWGIPALAALLTLLFALDFGRRRRALERLGVDTMMGLMANTIAHRRRVLSAVLMVTALVLCLATLAGPTASGETTWRQRGIDVVFVHDFSRSMMANDVYPSRLDRSLHEAENLLAGLKADRVATVVYAGGAAHFPLTHDHTAARLLYQGLRPSDLAPGSDQGQAIRMATCLLAPGATEEGLCEVLSAGAGGAPLQGQASVLRAESPEVDTRARVIVLFSDGEDSEGHALEEAAIAKNFGVELYVVAVGTSAGELLPSLDDEGQISGWEKNEEGAFVTTKLEAAHMLALSEAAQGHYYSLGQGSWQAESLLESLKELKRGDLDQRVIQSRRHIFEPFLFPAFLLLMLEACLSQRRRRAGLPRPGGGREHE